MTRNTRVVDRYQFTYERTRAAIVGEAEPQPAVFVQVDSLGRTVTQGMLFARSRGDWTSDLFVLPERVLDVLEEICLDELGARPTR